MKTYIRSRVLRATAIAGLSVAIAGGVAYATIPDGGKVYHACMLNNVGTIRLIDPTLPSSNLMSKCSSSLETPVSWSQAGPQGIQGPAGAAGKNGVDGKDGLNGKNGLDGKNGVDGRPGADGKDGAAGPAGAAGKDGAGITSSSLAPDSTSQICPTGGSRFSSPLTGDTYACNGKNGADGAPGKDGASLTSIEALNGVQCDPLSAVLTGTVKVSLGVNGVLSLQCVATYTNGSISLTGDGNFGFYTPVYGVVDDRTFTLSNTTSAGFGIASITVTGIRSRDYTVVGTTCGTRLDAGRTCTITVEFYPRSSGDSPGTLVVMGDVPRTAQLMGYS